MSGGRALIAHRDGDVASAGLAAAKTSGILGPLAAGADAEKKASAHSAENLTLSGMHRVLHKWASGLAEAECVGY